VSADSGRRFRQGDFSGFAIMKERASVPVLDDLAEDAPLDERRALIDPGYAPRIL